MLLPDIGPYEEFDRWARLPAAEHVDQHSREAVHLGIRHGGVAGKDVSVRPKDHEERMRARLDTGHFGVGSVDRPSGRASFEVQQRAISLGDVHRQKFVFIFLFGKHLIWLNA